MLRVEALIRIVAGKDIQIRTVRVDAAFKQARKVSSHEVLCKAGAQIPLRTAGPPAVRKDASILPHAGILIPITCCRPVEVPVLIMEADKVSPLVQVSYQGLQPLLSSCLLADRIVVRMAVVISRLRPAVQVEVDLPRPRRVKCLDLLIPLCKARQVVVLLRVLRIIGIGIRPHIGLDAHVDKAAPDQLLHSGVLGCLLPQGPKAALLLHVLPVDLAEVSVGAVLSEGHPKDSRIPHPAKAGEQVLTDLCPGGFSPVLRPAPGVPGSGADGEIPGFFLNLGKPGHVAARGQEQSVKGKGL